MSLEAFPQEIIAHITSYLDLEDLNSLDVTSRSFYKLSENYRKSFFLRIFVINNANENSTNLISSNEFQQWKEDFIKTTYELCSNFEQTKQKFSKTSDYQELLQKHCNRLKNTDPRKSWKSLFGFVVQAIKFSAMATPKVTVYKSYFDLLIPKLQHPSAETFNFKNAKSSEHIGHLLHWLLNIGAISSTFVGLLVSVGFPDAFSIPIDLSGLDLFKAFWWFCSRVQLPGEASYIDLWIGQFAQTYKNCNPSCSWKLDDIYLLCYSLVMLHTDAHNAKIKTKMSLAQFQRNLTGMPFTQEELANWYNITKVFRFTAKRWTRRKLTCRYSGELFLCLPAQARKLQFKTRQVKCFCKVENATFSWKCLDNYEPNDNSTSILNGEIIMNGTISVDIIAEPKYIVKVKNEETFPYIKIEHNGLNLKFFCETEENAEIWKACVQWCCLGFEAQEAKLNANIGKFFTSNQCFIVEK